MSESTIASKILKVLKAKNWTVYELSKRSGISQSTIAGILNEGKSPQLNTSYILQKVLIYRSLSIRY